MKPILSTAALLILFCPLLSIAQNEPVNADINKKIREEGLQHSQVADIIHYLTDVSGSRLTNSTGYQNASKWVAATFKKWQLSNVAREPWGEFGKGWDMENCTVALKAPYYHPIIGFPVAWSYGTNGPVSAGVAAVSYADSAAIRNGSISLKGKMVLITDSITHIRSAFKADASRYADSDLAKLKNAFWVTREELEPYINTIDMKKKFALLLKQQGALVIITKDYGGKDGSVYADASDPYDKNAAPSIPKLIIATEDFLRIQRLLKTGIAVQMEVNIKTKFISDDLNGYNVVGEIAGTDPVLKNELVIIGGHLDSWYSGTGATDNAAGCAAMMEAIRILQTLNFHPRRTIRIVLWGAEEQGLIGSYNYVKNHFGDPATKQLKAEQAKVSAYYNLDNGSGKIRGIFLQNNEAVRPIFKQWLAPFADLGATAISSGNTGETDHYTFDLVGIPGFQFIQDPLEYLTRTHHSNSDVYDHLSIDDLKQAATIIASFVYHTAMRDEKLPRKPLAKPEQWLFEGF